MHFFKGDRFAPVTGKNIIEKTVKHVNIVSGNMVKKKLWTPDQLSIVQAESLEYVIFDTFYSTGKSSVLQHHGKSKLKKGEKVHYFNHKPYDGPSNAGFQICPFTLMLQNEFPEGVVKETAFPFCTESVEGFLEEHGIEPTHHVIFDEVVCTDFSQQFVDSILKLKESVASLWIAMGSQPITGKEEF